MGFNDIGAVVLSGAAPLDRMELMNTMPLQLPGALSGLGLSFVDAFVGHVGDPRPFSAFLGGLSLQWRLQQRFTIGLQRGYMFGGPLYSRLSFRQKAQDFFYRYDTQTGPDRGGKNVYSLSMRWRLPTESILPLTLCVDWGSNDNPGGAVTWPGLVAGVKAPMLPGLPVSLGVEYAYFGEGPFGYHDPFP